jgi:DNA mismatch repair ATPase MutS
MNEPFHKTLQYSFGLNGYIDNLNGIGQHIAAKNMNACKFKKGVTKFEEGYYAALVHQQPVKNTYKLDKHLLITGPNAAGKTTLLKTTIFNIIISQQFGYGFYKKARLNPYDMIHCYINIPDTSARDSLFQAEAKRCKDILTHINTDANKNLRHFCVFDELYSGTNHYEAISSAYAFLKYLNKYDNVNFILTTHFLDLCQRLVKEPSMKNFHMLIDTFGDDFKYTYKLEKGISQIKGGVKVLKDLDYPIEIIHNTNDMLKELDN